MRCPIGLSSGHSLRRSASLTTATRGARLAVARLEQPAFAQRDRHRLEVAGRRNRDVGVAPFAFVRAGAADDVEVAFDVDVRGANGIAETAPAACTPGRRASVRSSTRRRPGASGPALRSSTKTWAITTFSAEKPGSTASSRSKLRMSRPAPERSTRANATSAATSPRRKRASRPSAWRSRSTSRPPAARTAAPGAARTQPPSAS